MPAGVASNQPNDALTAVRPLATSIDTHLLMSSLQRSGIFLRRCPAIQLGSGGGACATTSSPGSAQVSGTISAACTTRS